MRSLSASVAITLMSPTLTIAASLSLDIRQDIGIQVLSGTQPISHLAAAHQVSRKFIYQQVKTTRREVRLLARVEDVRTLLQWFSHDVLMLAGPELSIRQELFDFIATELKQRGGQSYPTIRKLATALHNQRDPLLAFAGVLDQKLADIAQRFELPQQAVRDVCLLHRKV